MGFDILNHGAPGKIGEYFNKDGKTTFNNLRLLSSNIQAEEFSHWLDTLIPSEVFKFLGVDKMKKFLAEDLDNKQVELLNWFTTKHYWRETGDEVIKSDEFLKDFFEYDFSLKTYKNSLAKKRFKDELVYRFHSKMTEMDLEMYEK